VNQNLVLVSGKSASGKSASLRNLEKPEGVMFLGCEAGKALPFPSKFREFVITDPILIFNAFEEAEKQSNTHTIVIDSLTFLMDMFESKYVITSSDGRKAWGDYAQYFKKLMQHYVANSSKNVIFMAHTADVYDESEMVMQSRVKVKGSIMNQGVEAYFTQVISSKVVPIKELQNYQNPMLTLTEEDELLGYKYVFQTRLTKDTYHERIRSPMAMWPTNYTFIDNDLQKVLNHTHSYYNS
jgi:hypothetical protein